MKEYLYCNNDKQEFEIDSSIFHCKYSTNLVMENMSIFSCGCYMCGYEETKDFTYHCPYSCEHVKEMLKGLTGCDGIKNE